jgi:HSP20 family protein
MEGTPLSGGTVAGSCASMRAVLQEIYVDHHNNRVGDDPSNITTEVTTMLMRTDPFRELDRLTQQVFGPDGTVARPSVMPMDAWRDGDTFHVEFDLPGVGPESIDIDVERNVVTVRAERAPRSDDAELIAAERPRGVFSRQLVLGDNLDTDRIEAGYDAGVLTLTIPVAEQAKPRKIEVSGASQGQQAISA